jgi:hypothetical protein
VLVTLIPAGTADTFDVLGALGTRLDDGVDAIPSRCNFGLFEFESERTWNATSPANSIATP